MLAKREGIISNRCDARSKINGSQISTIEKSGYYKDPNFMSQLEKVAKAEGWPLKFQGGQLVLTEDNLEIILTILGNNRVKSMVNEEKFDIEGVKKPI